MTLKYHLLLMALLSLRLQAFCQGWQIHVITPDYTANNCTEIQYPCFTLDDYLTQNITERFPSNTIVAFAPGYHYLSTDIVIEHVTNLELTGFESPECSPMESEEALSHVVCTKSAGFFFQLSINVVIKNLTFSFCGYQFPDTGQYAALLAKNIISLHLSHVVIRNSTGYGLSGFNVLGNSTIKNCCFLFNNYYTLKKSSCRDIRTFIDFSLCNGGGANFIYADMRECPSTPLHFSLQIISSLFTHSVNVVPYNLGSALAISLKQSSYGVEVLVENSTFTKNYGRNGASIKFFAFGDLAGSSFTVQHCNISESNPNFPLSVQNLLEGEYIGGGLLYAGYPLDDPLCGEQTMKDHIPVLRVLDTNFTKNLGTRGAGLYIVMHVNRPAIPFVIVMENCHFVENNGSPGSAIAVLQAKNVGKFTFALQIIVKNCTFAKNSYPPTIRPNYVQKFEDDIFNTLALFSVQDVIFIDCWFEENAGTPIYAYDSQLHFYGNVTIVKNSGVNGGGLYLGENSLMLLLPNIHLYLLNNSALGKGGGIFVPPKNLGAKDACFFQIDHRNLSSISVVFQNFPPDGSNFTVHNSDAINSEVILKSNTAKLAGSAIYGGDVDRCLSIFRSGTVDFFSNGFDDIFKCDDITCTNKGNDKSLVSSNPTKLCSCDAVTLSHNCSLDWPQFNIYPGQSLVVPVLSFAQRGGISPRVVFANIFFNSSQKEQHLRNVQRTQEVRKDCTDLTYTIYYGAPTMNLMLTLENSAIEDTPANITIHLRPCPPGFNLSATGTSFSCQCNDFLQSHDITCDIDTQTVHRPKQKWLSLDLYTDRTEDSNVVLLHNFCPFDYCESEELLHFNLALPDAQCAFNRTGVLCGACEENFSVTLGGSQCLSCSNEYLSLLIPFAVAGLCLVLVLFILNTLTVATGIISGLIFYANIVQYNRGIFFPPDQTNMLTVFISWLNLDLGITTCFYDGMDTYSKIWLQYVFPVYIWLIVVAIIVTSRYSMRVAKMAGKHAVPVLATLLLLSFAKILRTIITSLSVTKIYRSDHHDETRWLFDANIKYIGDKHVPLFLFSIFTLLFFAIPFISVLIFSPLLLKLSSYRLFKWVNRLKPFFDAFEGPYKIKQRNWTGVLLFMRGLLFLIYSLKVLQGPGVILLSTIIASCILMAYGLISGGIYKQWPLDVLEISFFVNLNLLASATLYTHSVGGNQGVVIYISTAIALLEFVGIVAYSLMCRLGLPTHFDKYLEFFKKFKGMMMRSRCDSQSNEASKESDMKDTPVTSSSAHMSYSEVLREPLLEMEL